MKLLIFRHADQDRHGLDACLLIVQDKYDLDEVHEKAADAGIKSPNLESVIELGDINLDDYGLYEMQPYTG